MRNSKIRTVLVPVGAAIVAAGTIGALSAVGASKDSVSAPPAQATLNAGTPISADAVASLGGKSTAATYRADLQNAKSLPSPSADGGRWLVTPAANDGACVIVGSLQTCGEGKDIASGEFGVTSVVPNKLTEDQLAANRKALRENSAPPFNAGVVGGKTTRYGIAPPRTESVTAVSDGKTISTTTPQSGLYQIDLGQGDGTAQVVNFKDASGQVIASTQVLVR